MNGNLEIIEAAVYRYARRHGATPDDADDLADFIVRQTKSACKHRITAAGFDPDKWKD